MLKPHLRIVENHQPTGCLAIVNGSVFLGTSTPETHGFLPSNGLGFPVKMFPSSKSMIPVVPHKAVAEVSE